MTRYLLPGLVAISSLGIVLVAGCADSGNTVPPRDGGRPGDAMDSGAADTMSLPDTPADTFSADAPPAPTLTTCEACATGADCLSGFCARLVDGSRACLPGCEADLPDCPRNNVGEFSCIFDATGTGIDGTICAPVGGPCCVDEDGDGYGTGVGCDGTDCNDSDPDVHPDRTEICDGRDTNCNGVVDEPPTDCEAGFCRLNADGSYSSTTSARCAAAVCGAGTATSCGLFTCSLGGEEGLTCATSCLGPTGADDDSYCIAGAHCDTGVCVDDVDDGGSCNEDTDCSGNHCDSDICCASGDCCVTAANCPGGGAVTRLCDAPTMCQGHRGEATCGADFRCMVTSGIDDDTACDGGVTARDCGLYDPIVCTGAASQTDRMCPTSCVVDTDCIEAAHCSVGFCVPDLPPGGPCARSGDCGSGLFCTDNVCCTSVCNGTCEACNLPGTAGTCTLVPSGGDPSGECAGYSCSGYYSASGDACYRRTDVSDSAAVCNGTGACRSPDTVCPTQPPGALYSDCNDVCQSMRSGTCTGTTAAICDNIPGSPPTTTCGMGLCATTVNTCTAGAPNTCSPGTPQAETCDGLDNNCNGSPDDGTSNALCPPTSGVPSGGTLCGGGNCTVTACNTGYADIDGLYSSGCECNVGTNASCPGAAMNIAVAVGANSLVNGAVPNGGERWYSFTFPRTPSTVRPGGGTPHITVTPAGDFEMLVVRDCGGSSTFTCETGGSPVGTAASVTDWVMTDDESIAGPNAFSDLHTYNWPDQVYVRVRRRGSATSCSSASFTLTVSR